MSKNTATSLPQDSHLLTYWNKDVDGNIGRLKGAIISITPDLRQFGGKRNKNQSNTIVSADFELIKKLLRGEMMIDVDKTNELDSVFINKKDNWRLSSCRYIEDDTKQWKDNPNYQEPAPKNIYINYIRTFLQEFTSLVSHIPIKKKLDLFPLCMLEPCNVKILVARDAIAFVYNSPKRPENEECIIDTNRILDELLLPHPQGKSYLITAPHTTWKVDSSEYYLIQKFNGHLRNSPFCNPYFLHRHKKLHALYYDLNYRRVYPDRLVVDCYIIFAEIFGDITENNFSEKLAIDRARQFVKQVAINNWTGLGPSQFKESINNFINIIEDVEASEPSIEAFLDVNKWILERGLGIQRYYSQVKIPKEICSDRAERNYKPDKFLERHDGYCDILDLKLPLSKIILKNKDWSYFSSQISKNEGQILKYGEIANEPKVREFLLKSGIKILFPRIMLLIGRRPVGKLLEEFQTLKRNRSIIIVTYDDILDEIMQTAKLLNIYL